MTTFTADQVGLEKTVYVDDLLENSVADLEHANIEFTNYRDSLVTLALNEYGRRPLDYFSVEHYAINENIKLALPLLKWRGSKISWVETNELLHQLGKTGGTISDLVRITQMIMLITRHTSEGYIGSARDIYAESFNQMVNEFPEGTPSEPLVNMALGMMVEDFSWAVTYKVAREMLNN